MNKKGGYQIIDLKDFNFTKNTDSFVLLKGTYDECISYINNLFKKNSKTILFTNIVINGIEKNDCFFQLNYTDELLNYDIYFNLYGESFELTYNQIENDLYSVVVNYYFKEVV